MAGPRYAGELARMLGVALLDRAAPADMEAAIAGADLILVLDDAPRAWLAPLRARARLHGVPVFVPRDAVELVAALHTVAKPSGLDKPEPVVTGDVPGITLERIRAAFRPPVSTAWASSGAPSDVDGSAAFPSFLETVR